MNDSRLDRRLGVAGDQATGPLGDGETVATSAAAGGDGHLTVELGKPCGCRIVAACGVRRADKVRLLKSIYDAVERLSSGVSTGKVVVDPRP